MRGQHGEPADPAWTSAITGHAEFALALVSFGLLVFWKLSPWLVVLVAAAAGAVIGAVT